jgi:hypothetical protein
VILEAFSQVLRAPENADRRAMTVLSQWLNNTLIADASDPVSKVIHAEIERHVFPPRGAVFQGRSPSGDRLLASLMEYCQSYEHWQYSRWLHQIKASDFSALSH